MIRNPLTWHPECFSGQWPAVLTGPDLEAPGSPGSAPFYWHFLHSTLSFTGPAVIPSQPSPRKQTSLCCCLKPGSLGSPWLTQMGHLHTRKQIAVVKPCVIKCFPLRNRRTSQVTLKVKQPPWKTANRNPGCCKPPSVSHRLYGSVHNGAPFTDEDWVAHDQILSLFSWAWRPMDSWN